KWNRRPRASVQRWQLGRDRHGPGQLCAKRAGDVPSELFQDKHRFGVCAETERVRSWHVQAPEEGEAVTGTQDQQTAREGKSSEGFTRPAQASCGARGAYFAGRAPREHQILCRVIRPE